MHEEYFVDIGERYLVVLEGSPEGLLPRLFSRIDEYRLRSSVEQVDVVGTFEVVVLEGNPLHLL
jgi:hypothetical protein